MARKINKAVIDALLIVFSVLLALMLNKSFEAWQEHKTMEAAEKAIRNEMGINKSLVKSLVEIHLSIQKRLNSLVDNKGDSLRNVLLEGKYFNFWVILDNKSFLPVIPKNLFSNSL